MYESLSFSVCKLFQKRQLHINTYFSVTGWMLCFVTHIHKDAKYNWDSDNRKQVNNFIKTLFSEESEEEMSVTQDIFWTDYTNFDNKIDWFDADEFKRKSKDIKYGNSNLWHQKYLIPCTKVLGFVSCRVTSKVLGIVAEECSWSD